MARTVVAFERDETRNKIAQLLESSGIPVRFCHRSGAEVIRSVKRMGSGVVICGQKLADMPVDLLAHALGDQARFLVLAKPAQLALCEDPSLFKLPSPISAGELRGAVNVLIQLDELAARGIAPQRSQADNELIARAKEFLMESRGLSEDQAHRYLQRASMKTGEKLAATARRVLFSETEL